MPIVRRQRISLRKSSSDSLHARIHWATEFARESLAVILPQMQVVAELQNSLNENVIPQIAPLFVHLFVVVQEPPIGFTDYLHLYQALFVAKQARMLEKTEDLDISLAKLNEALKTIDTLSVATEVVFGKICKLAGQDAFIRVRWFHLLNHYSRSPHETIMWVEYSAQEYIKLS
jgi:hypothetical protein